MLTVEDLEVCAKKLHVYDVEQGAWEQEPNGFEANAGHVLKHLRRDIIGKDFKDAAVVRTALVPDALQYALRLGRWSGVVPEDMFPLPVGEMLARSVDARHGAVILQAAKYAAGTRVLADNLHDLEHAATREVAIKRRKDAMRSAGGMLLHYVEAQVVEFRMNPVETFDARLAHLRERFGIPQPVS